MTQTRPKACVNLLWLWFWLARLSANGRWCVGEDSNSPLNVCTVSDCATSARPLAGHTHPRRAPTPPHITSSCIEGAGCRAGGIVEFLSCGEGCFEPPTAHKLLLSFAYGVALLPLYFAPRCPPLLTSVSRVYSSHTDSAPLLSPCIPHRCP